MEFWSHETIQFLRFRPSNFFPWTVHLRPSSFIYLHRPLFAFPTLQFPFFWSTSLCLWTAHFWISRLSNYADRPLSLLERPVWNMTVQFSPYGLTTLTQDFPDFNRAISLIYTCSESSYTKRDKCFWYKKLLDKYIWKCI